MWSRFWDRCRDCGTDDREHKGRGFCERCYSRRRRAGRVPQRYAWSLMHERCVSCGTTEQKHEAIGLCKLCYWLAYNSSPRGRAANRASCRRYAATDRGRQVSREHSRRTRDKTLSASGDLAPVGYEEVVFDVFGMRCVACGAEDDLVLDHHRPLQDGHALLHNAVPLCRTCNSRKRTNPPEEFYDGWKLTEIAVLLFETKTEFERRFPEWAAA